MGTREKEVQRHNPKRACVLVGMRHRFAMRNSLLSLAALLICGVRTFAQMGGPSGGANFDNGMDKLFDSNPVFTATLQSAINTPNGPMDISSKMYFDHGNSRTDMNMDNAQGASLPPGALAQMKAFGMDQINTIAPATKTNVFLIYPNIHAYLSMPTVASGQSTNDVQITKIGSDTVDGHPCIENKVIVMAGDQPHEFTVWNATGLKNFPVKISISEQGTSVTMSFQNISFDPIDASTFQPPAGDTRYDSIQALMQTVMMNHAGGAPAPGAPPPGQ
jgi:hypothetical protein